MTVSVAELFGPEHDAFVWPGNRNRALLVHGFPSSPAELRRVGAILHEAGWSVEGLLLPGFGRGWESIGARRAEEWRDTVLAATRAARQEADRVLLVGNSMGGALALHAAAQVAVDGLVLFCPFWRVNSRLADGAWPLLHSMVRSLRPLQRADFTSPALRGLIGRFLPEIDLDRANVQEALRQLTLPTSVLGEVRRVGRWGYDALPRVQAPTLILQGTRDPLAHPSLTRALATQVTHLAGYVEIASDHELAHLRKGEGPAVGELLRTFLRRVEGAPTLRARAGGA